MSEQHDQNHDEEESGLSPFEQQLRSVKPAPPQTAWQEIAQLLEAQPKVGPSILASPRQVPGWQRIRDARSGDADWCWAWERC